jgi:hypothetical protein
LLTDAESIGLVKSYLESKSYEGITKVLIDREVPCTQLEMDLAEWGYPLIEPSCKTKGTSLELVPLEAPVVLPCSDTIQGPLTAQYLPVEGVWEASAQAVDTGDASRGRWTTARGRSHQPRRRARPEAGELG